MMSLCPNPFKVEYQCSTESVTILDIDQLPLQQRLERQAALTSTTFLSLTKHAHGVAKLSEAILKIPQAAVVKAETSIQKRHWNDPCLLKAAAENILILLYAMGQLNNIEFLNAVIIIKCFQQFGLSELKTPYDLPCQGCTVVDITTAEHSHHKKIFLEQIKRKSRYGCELPFITALSKNPNLSAEVIVITMKFEDNKPHSPSYFPSEQYNLYSAFKWLNELEKEIRGPVFFAPKHNAVYIPTLSFLNNVLQLEGHSVALMPVLGTTSAADLQQYRSQEQHPVLVQNRLIDNNYDEPHELFASRLFATLHDVQHWEKLSAIEPHWRRCSLKINILMLHLFHKMQPPFMSAILIQSPFTRTISVFLSHSKHFPIEFKDDFEQLLQAPFHNQNLQKMLKEYIKRQPFLDQAYQPRTAQEIGCGIYSCFEDYLIQTQDIYQSHMEIYDYGFQIHKFYAFCYVMYQMDVENLSLIQQLLEAKPISNLLHKNVKLGLKLQLEFISTLQQKVTIHGINSTGGKSYVSLA
ncbi:MAG: hypothetical protein ACPGUD_11515 [Parashewanella sp.]